MKMRDSNVQGKKRNQKPKTRLNKKVFFRSIIVFLAVCFLIVISGKLVINSMIKPPEIPLDVDDGIMNLNDVAFLPPDGAEEDMHIGNNLRAPKGFTDADRKEEFYTFLIVGLDEGVNTDTIMVASYDGIHKEANVISIPRDSLVNVKRKVKKINSAYPAGTLHGGGKDGGINQLKKEVKTIIGFVPDFYVCIDLEAFEKIVDALGGINVNVPMNLKYDDPYQDLHIDIKAGEQVLNGENALKFARYRKGNNKASIITDYQRIENQQTVIKAVLAKLINPANIVKVPEFIDLFNEHVYSDMKTENLLWLASQLNKIKGTDALSTHTMPTNGGSGLPMYYEYLDKPSIVQLVNDTINPYTKDIEAKHLDIISQS